MKSTVLAPLCDELIPSRPSKVGPKSIGGLNTTTFLVNIHPIVYLLSVFCALIQCPLFNDDAKIA